MKATFAIIEQKGQVSMPYYEMSLENGREYIYEKTLM